MRAGARGVSWRRATPVEALAAAIRSAAATRNRSSQGSSAVDVTAGDNTAIVLDSTSDFFDARERRANMRIVPLYVLFDGEALRDHVDIGPAAFYERLGELERRSRPPPPRAPGDFLACLQGAPRRRVPAHLVAPPDVEAVGHARVRGAGGRAARRRTSSASSTPRPPRSHARCSPKAMNRRLEDGTTDEAIQVARRSVQGREPRRVHGGHPRVPPEGRPDRQGPGARGVASPRQADPLGVARRGGWTPSGGSTARQKAVAEFAKLFEEKRRGSRRASRCDSPRERAWVDRDPDRHRR